MTIPIFFSDYNFVEVVEGVEVMEGMHEVLQLKKDAANVVPIAQVASPKNIVGFDSIKILYDFHKDNLFGVYCI